jgi:hypothetical protein
MEDLFVRFQPYCSEDLFVRFQGRPFCKVPCSIEAVLGYHSLFLFERVKMKDTSFDL